MLSTAKTNKQKKNRQIKQTDHHSWKKKGEMKSQTPMSLKVLPWRGASPAHMAQAERTETYSIRLFQHPTSYLVLQCTTRKKSSQLPHGKA